MLSAVCVTPQALLSGLVRRIEREARHVTASELSTLIEAGLASSGVEAALVRARDRSTGEARAAFEVALERLKSIR